jgi:glycosyltransferase involved in cell wall biosynthesis
MPAWNAEQFIVPVLESLAAQTYPNLQVLISDDASTDRTAAICEEFVARHPNFRLIRQPRNLGWIGNVNALLSAADGKYFFFAFHDDWPMPAYVERLVDALESNPRAVLSFSDMLRRGATARQVVDDIKVYLDLEGITNRVERGVRVARRQGKPPSYLVMVANRGLFRASAARQVSGMRRHIAGEFGADWPWLLSLSLVGEFVRVPEVLVEKRYRPGSLSATFKHSAWQWLGLYLGCVREIRRAKLPLAEELMIYRELVGYPLKRRWWGICARLRSIRSQFWPPAANDRS